MKRSISLLLAAVLFSATCLGSLPAAAAPGDQTDPAVSLSYLTSIYQPGLISQLHANASYALNQIYNEQFLELAETVGAYNLQREQANTGARRTDGIVYLKQNDTLTLLPGTKVMPISGTLTTDSSSLINVSAGERVATGQTLTAKTLYMKDDSSSGGFRVTSESAALVITGPYRLSASSSTDWASRADVLNEMSLFLGSSVGYELERTATRIQGLVVFIRIMGLEDEALAYTGTHPFTDVPTTHWAYRYVAYAYAHGFTNGTTATTFSPNNTISARHYIAFMMRALGYEETVDFNYATILTDCVTLGLFNSAEVSTIANGSFTRGRMVYLSYYSLFATMPDSGTTLLTDLVSRGVVTQATADRAVCQVVGTRIE